MFYCTWIGFDTSRVWALKRTKNKQQTINNYNSVVSSASSSFVYSSLLLSYLFLPLKSCAVRNQIPVQLSFSWNYICRKKTEYIFLKCGKYVRSYIRTIRHTNYSFIRAELGCLNSSLFWWIAKRRQIVTCHMIFKAIPRLWCHKNERVYLACRSPNAVWQWKVNKSSKGSRTIHLCEKLKAEHMLQFKSVFFRFVPALGRLSVQSASHFYWTKKKKAWTGLVGSNLTNRIKFVRFSWFTSAVIRIFIIDLRRRRERMRTYGQTDQLVSFNPHKSGRSKGQRAGHGVYVTTCRRCDCESAGDAIANPKSQLFN